MYWFYFIDALDINHKLQGQAEIIPIFEPGQKEPEDIKAKWVGCNENKPIKFLISAPTMRVPADVSSTCNAYLAFRGIILAGNKTITVRQRSDEGYVFSRVCPSFCLLGGSLCDHYLWCIEPYCTGTSPPLPQPSPPDMRPEDFPLLLTSGGHYWRPVQTCHFMPPQLVLIFGGSWRS